MKIFLAAVIIKAPAAKPGIAPGVCPLNPNIAFNSFSAGNINPKHIITYIGFVVANFIAEPINSIYNNKCNGCNNKLYKYSLNQKLNACAVLSFTLSIGYVSATSGEINVKNTI